MDYDDEFTPVKMSGSYVSVGDPHKRKKYNLETQRILHYRF